MKLRIQEHALLAPFTTFQIGGPARWLVDVAGVEDIDEAVRAAQGIQMPFVFMAGGSNVLVADHGFKGLVLRITGGESRIAEEHVFADAGCNLETLIRESAVAGLTGWEKLAGIPGTLGGAIRGNAGAFGAEMKDVVNSVRAYNIDTHAVRDFPNAKCDFSYRHSYFKDHPEWVILRAVLKLKRGNSTKSLKEITDTLAERNRRHIQNVRAAGSFFMNPEAPHAIRLQFEQEKQTKAKERRVPAGWLIEKAGYKGVRVGGARASDQHPNYIVNTGEATASDVMTLANEIKEAVKEYFGIELKEEVSFLGH